MVRRFILKNGGEDTRLKKIIDEQSVLKSKEKKKVRSSMYASDYGQCQRRIWYQFFPERFPVDLEIDARLARIFDNGNSVHDRLGGYLKRVQDIEFIDEVDVPRDALDVHGRCDGICKIDDRAVVVEFKSINLEVVEKPKPEHIGQLTWYLHMFNMRKKDLAEDFQLSLPANEDEIIHAVSLSGRTFEDLLPFEKWLMTTQGDLIGELVYECKGKQTVFTFPVEYDEKKAEAISLWFEQVAQAVKEDERPVVKYNQGFYPCSWSGDRCAYWEYCHGSKAHLFKKPEDGDNK